MTSLEVLKPPHIQGVHRTQLFLSPGLQRPRPDPRHPSAAHAFLRSSARSRFHLLNLSISFLCLLCHHHQPGSSCQDHETWEWVSTIPSVEVKGGLPYPCRWTPTSFPTISCPGIIHSLQVARLAFALSPKGYMPSLPSAPLKFHVPSKTVGTECVSTPSFSGFPSLTLRSQTSSPQVRFLS